MELKQIQLAEDLLEQVEGMDGTIEEYVSVDPEFGAVRECVIQLKEELECLLCE